MNTLHYGDNLDVMREHMQAESVDLIYLDPPFNSQASYNVLFKTPVGEASAAQAEAFQDSWTWGSKAEGAYAEVLARGGPTAAMLTAFRSWLHESDMMAYLTMMAARLEEMHRVLKPTGSLYLHCDPTASHYLKVLLDGIFGGERFRNEVVWKRTHAHGNVRRAFGAIHDCLLWYTKTERYAWNQQYRRLTKEQAAKKYPKVDPDGRRWQAVTLRNPSPRPNLRYPFKASNGITYQPHPNGWACRIERLQQYDAEKRLYFPPSPNGALRLKMYEDESPGERLQSIWDDIPPINSSAKERLGYPTQKPLALLDRIIRTSTDEDGVVLDPFCGCGTTVHAAQAAGRGWVGIDITHHAISLIETRLEEHFPALVGKVDIQGRPRDADGARHLAAHDKYQFQWWANWKVGVQLYNDRKKGADRGIDGTIYFANLGRSPDGFGRVIVSVKGGENVGVGMVRELRGTLETENADLGLLVTVRTPTPAMTKEAAAAGMVATSQGQFPKLQIVSVDQLFGGGPDLPRPYTLQEANAGRPVPARKHPKSGDPRQGHLPLPMAGGLSEPSGGRLTIDPRFRFELTSSSSLAS